MADKIKKIRGRWWVMFLAVAVLGGVVWCLNLYGHHRETVILTKAGSKEVIVIDPGHGGDDPGKVGVGGSLEKDVNLAIAKKLARYMQKSGYTVYMTREGDDMLTKEGIRSKKMQDLTARAEKIKEWDPALVISIHQNSYPREDIQGAQVFYYKESEEGKKLAETIQDLLRSGLDPGNKRVAKSDMSYFMLKESKQPIVIVECGFLSNPQEEKKLSEEKYQDTIVRCVAEGVENFLYKW